MTGPDLSAENAAPAVEQSADQILGLGVAEPAVPAAAQPTEKPQPQDQEPAPATEEPASPWTPEQLALDPGLAKFKTLDALIESRRGLEKTFHGYRQAGLDPDAFLQRVITDRHAANGDAEVDEDQPPADGEPKGPTDEELDTPIKFLDDFATNPRARVRAEARAEAEDVFEERFAARMAQYEKARDVSKSSLETFVGTHPDAKALEGKMSEIFAKNPHFLSEYGMDGTIDMLYRMAGGKGGEASKAELDEAKEKARQEVRDTIVETGRVAATPASRSRSDASVADEILAGTGAGQPVLRPV